MMTCRIGILGTGSYLPAKVLTNDELERFLDTPAQKIVDLTGIRERRIATQYSGPGNWPTVLYEAIEGRKHLHHGRSRPQSSRTGADQSVAGALHSCRHELPGTDLPATAIKIQHYIGADHAIAWDLQASCTGFIFALIDAERQLFVDKHRSARINALVIGSDTMSRTVSRLDRNTAIMFADGAGAVVLGTTLLVVFAAVGCARSIAAPFNSTLSSNVGTITIPTNACPRISFTRRPGGLTLCPASDA